MRGKLYDKVIALLGYLVAESHRSHSREHLAMLLWPALSADAARTNLRQALYYLRQAFHTDTDALLATNRDTVRFVYCASHCRVDLKSFTEPAPNCLRCTAMPLSAPCEQCLSHLKTRADAYQGEFLAGLSLTDAPDFDIWVEAQRLNLRGQAFALAEQLTHAYESQGKLETALVHALRCIQLEPWNEAGHRQHMRLLASKGQHGAAQAFYDVYRDNLARDLNVEPERSTHALFEAIRRRGLEAGHKPSSEMPQPAPVTETGRRQATILCCHVGFRPVTNEASLEQLAAPRSVCAAVLRRHAGYITLGQGGYIYAYMGYPEASEHAGMQAVRAALELQACFAPPYRFQAGIHTGIIVTGFDPALPDIIGNVSAFAWRLCRRMQRGGIAVSDSTRRLLQGRFYFEPLKPLRAKGNASDSTSDQMPVYKLADMAQAGRHAAIEPRAGLIGRKPELQRLRRLWQLASSGRPQFLVVRGEAGLGKTRIARALRDETDSANSAIRHLHCYPERQHTPFYPIIALFETTLGFSGDDTVAHQREKLHHYLAHHHPAIASLAYPILMAMLSIAPPDAPVLPPRQRRQQTLDMLLTLMDSMAMRGALLLIIEDAQWLDITSLDLLERLVHRKDPIALFTLITARNEFAPPWLQTGSVLELQPLKDEHIAHLAQVATRKSLTKQSIAHIVKRADGIPLYAEEMARLSTSSPDDIPSSLHYLLRIRLDAVPHARRLLQLAATIGRKFERGLLQRVSALDDGKLDGILHQLSEARLISCVAPHDATFQFHHALIQEAAYTSQIHADMQEAHKQVAAVLSTHYAHRAAQQPGEVARHYTAADDISGALPWWLTAGRQALRVSANAEACGHLQTGLGLARKLPQSKQRDAIEREFLVSLGQALLLLRGYGSEDAAEVFDRALMLDDASVSPRQRFEILWGQWMVSSSRPGSSFVKSWDLTQQLLQLARDSGDDDLLVQSYSAATNISLWRNQLDDACRYAQAATAQSTTAKTRSTLEGLDPRVTSLAHLSWAYWRLGRVSEALATSRRSVTLAQSLDTPDTLCFALGFAAILHRFLGNSDITAKLARQLRRIADFYQLVLWRGIGDMLLAWKQALDGNDGGLTNLKACVQGIKQIMPGVAVMFIHAQAEAYGFLGRHDEQLRAIDEGLQAARQVHEGFFRSLLEQLRDQCLARRTLQ